MTGTLIHVRACHLLGGTSISLVVVALKRSVSEHVSKHALSDLENVGWHVMSSLRDCHQGELTIWGTSVVATNIDSIDS